MGYLKTIGLASLYGIANGAFFYVLGGVAAPIFPSITPALLGAIGFFVAAGIALQKESK